MVHTIGNCAVIPACFPRALIVRHLRASEAALEWDATAPETGQCTGRRRELHRNAEYRHGNHLHPVR